MKNQNQWAIIGGRIEDYAAIASTEGFKIAAQKIREIYKDESESVIAGLKIFIKYGPVAYYQGRNI